MSELIDVYNSSMNQIIHGIERNHCDNAYLQSINGYVCIVLAFIQFNDMFLLDKRAKGKIASGLWELPGGAVQSDEPFDHAIQRELSEELGIHCFYKYKKIQTLGNIHYHCYFYTLDSIDLQFELDTNEVEAIQWVNVEQFEQLCNSSLVVNPALIKNCIGDSSDNNISITLSYYNKHASEYIENTKYADTKSICDKL